MPEKSIFTRVLEETPPKFARDLREILERHKPPLGMQRMSPSKMAPKFFEMTPEQIQEFYQANGLEATMKVAAAAWKQRERRNG